jgi:hypothetical protein
MKNKNVFVRLFNFLFGRFIKEKSEIIEPVEDLQNVIVENNTEQENQVKKESQFNLVLGICRKLSSNCIGGFEITFNVKDLKSWLKFYKISIDDTQLNKVLYRMKKRGVLIPVNQTKKYCRTKEYKLSKKWK